MGNHNFGILRSHGTLAIGQTCGDTFMRMYFLERACSMQIRAQAGEKVRKPNQGVPELMADSLRSFDGALGRLAWPAIQRRVARTWPDYLQ